MFRKRAVIVNAIVIGVLLILVSGAAIMTVGTKANATFKPVATQRPAGARTPITPHTSGLSEQP